MLLAGFGRSACTRSGNLKPSRMKNTWKTSTCERLFLLHAFIGSLLKRSRVLYCHDNQCCLQAMAWHTPCAALSHLSVRPSTALKFLAHLLPAEKRCSRIVQVKTMCNFQRRSSAPGCCCQRGPSCPRSCRTWWQSRAHRASPRGYHARASPAKTGPPSPSVGRRIS